MLLCHSRAAAQYTKETNEACRSDPDEVEGQISFKQVCSTEEGHMAHTRVVSGSASMALSD